jgi:hypothetical protein
LAVAQRPEPLAQASAESPPDGGGQFAVKFARRALSGASMGQSDGGFDSAVDDAGPSVPLEVRSTIHTWQVCPPCRSPAYPAVLSALPTEAPQTVLSTRGRSAWQVCSPIYLEFNSAAPTDAPQIVPTTPAVDDPIHSFIPDYNCHPDFAIIADSIRRRRLQPHRLF